MRHAITLCTVLAFSQCAGCALFKPVVKTALDVIQTMCALESKTTDVEAVAVACNVSEDLTPALRQLLAAKVAVERKAACHGSH